MITQRLIIISLFIQQQDTKMKELATKFLNSNGYFPCVSVTSDKFDNGAGVGFKAYYNYTCYANEHNLQIVMEHSADIVGVLEINGFFEVNIYTHVSNEKAKIDSATRKDIAMQLSAMTTEILKCCK